MKTQESTRYALRLEFDGTGYCGWQEQSPKMEKAKASLQMTFQKALLKLLGIRKKIHIQGCGRTDAGVHAEEFVAHFDLPLKYEEKFQGETRRLRLGLNSLLPKGLSVKNVYRVDRSFESLENAQSKVYEYRILLRMSKPALELGRVYWIPSEKMNEERFDYELFSKTLKHFVGTKDFAAFASSGHSLKTTVRTIYSVECNREILTQERGHLIRVRFHGSGFLKQQVRNMVGASIAVAMKKRNEDFVLSLLEASKGPETRISSLYCAPPEGLFLLKVNYDRSVFTEEASL